MSQLNLAPHPVEGNATDHVIHELPILVILPHSRCNCRCMMCDIWRIRQVREITAADLQPHLASLRELKVRWVVFSGGEPLMHSDLFALSRLLRCEGIRTTLLTAGLTLQAHAAQVAEDIDDVIVSIDGPAEIHDRIRGRPDAYRRLELGTRALRVHRPSIPIHGRCTVQKSNFRHLGATVTAALDLKLDSLSFLAADVSSAAFNHRPPLPEDILSTVALDANEVDGLCVEVERVIGGYCQLIQSGFIRENPEKLRRIGLHFRSHLGQAPPVAPRCNAPASSRQETRELRAELQGAISKLSASNSATGAQDKGAMAFTKATTTTPQQPAPPSTTAEASTQGRLSRIEEDQQLLQAKVDEQHQTKVESASRYRVKLSGIALLNLFGNAGTVDNQDVPNLALQPGPVATSGSVGATVRQSEIGLEAYGPTFAGARASANLNVDFMGGFTNASNGVTEDLVRMRTATVRLDWKQTSLVAGQDAPFFSPLSPTSFASLGYPAFSDAGNLWTWTPQIRLEHRLNLSEANHLMLQGGVLDPLSGESPYPTFPF